MIATTGEIRMLPPSRMELLPLYLCWKQSFPNPGSHSGKHGDFVYAPQTSHSAEAWRGTSLALCVHLLTVVIGSWGNKSYDSPRNSIDFDLLVGLVGHISYNGGCSGAATAGAVVCRCLRHQP